MWVFKLWYLLYFASSSCLVPYFNLIFRRYGIAENYIGGLALLRPFVGLPAGGIFSAIADRYRAHRSVLMVALIVSIVTRLLIFFFRSFEAILMIVIAAGTFSAPVTIMVDSCCLAACTGEDGYARQRMYGAIGWGTFSLLSGYSMDILGLSSAFLLYGVLSLGALIPSMRIPWDRLEEKVKMKSAGEVEMPDMSMVVDRGDRLVVVDGNRSVVEDGDRSVVEDGDRLVVDGNAIMIEDDGEGIDTLSKSNSKNKAFLDKVRTLLQNPDACVFFAMTLIMGTAVGTIEGFLFLFLEDLGGSSLLMGLTLTCTCVSETLVFYYSQSIISRFGIDKCLHVCFLAFCVRLAAYSSMRWWPSPWLVLPVEFLHGITFGLTWSVGSQKSTLISPPGLEATTQSIFQGLMFGLGYGLGGLVGGMMYQFFGPSYMFLFELAIVVVGWLCCSVGEQVYCRAPRLKGKQSGTYMSVSVEDVDTET